MSSWARLAAIFRSCSISCLLQLCKTCQLPACLEDGTSAHLNGRQWPEYRCRQHVLSARHEAAIIGQVVSEFAVGAQPPHQACKGEDQEATGSRVGFPVRGLAVPPAGGRPHMLGIARAGSGQVGSRSWRWLLPRQTYGTLAPPPWCLVRGCAIDRVAWMKLTILSPPTALMPN